MDWFWKGWRIYSLSGHDNKETKVPLEALLKTDEELISWLHWAPLSETGEPMQCGACEDICTCEGEIKDG